MTAGDPEQRLAADYDLVYADWDRAVATVQAFMMPAGSWWERSPHESGSGTVTNPVTDARPPPTGAWPRVAADAGGRCQTPSNPYPVPIAN